MIKRECLYKICTMKASLWFCTAESWAIFTCIRVNWRQNPRSLYPM